jgi:hypothetical protein
MYRAQSKTTLSLKDLGVKILIPQAGIILSYLIVTKLLFGSWLWHSGNFDTSFSLSQLAGTGLKYMAKFFLFYRYLPVNSADQIFRQIFGQHGFVLLVFLFMGTLFFSGILFLIKKKNVNGLFLVGLFMCFAISLLPVLSLDSSFLKYIYPDRYGYLPSVFFYIFLSCSLFFLFKKMAPFILLGYAVLCWVLLAQTIPVWNSANEYCKQITENYKPFLKYDRVYVLNIPAYYKGLAAFRSAFPETIFEKFGSSPTDKIRIVSGSYLKSDSDSLLSVSRNGKTVTVSGPQKKTPFFSTDGGWPRSYETDQYSVKFDTSGCSYTLSFRQEIPENSAFIYTLGGTWKKAD